MNAIADSMLLLDEPPLAERLPIPNAYAADRDAADREAADWREAVLDDRARYEDEDQDAPPAAFDGERVLDWTVRGICACSLQAQSAPPG